MSGPPTGTELSVGALHIAIASAPWKRAPTTENACAFKTIFSAKYQGLNLLQLTSGPESPAIATSIPPPITTQAPT